MSLATLDTHEVVEELRSAGFTDEQAAAVARNLRKAQDLDLSSLATKADLSIETEKIRGEIAKNRLEIGKEIADTKVDILKYLFGTIGFQTLIIIGAVVTLIKLVKP